MPCINERRIFKRTRLVFLFVNLLFSLLCTDFKLSAQQPPSQKHVDLLQKSEKEVLNVLEDWITWNNPGSALIDFFNLKAKDLYIERQNEIGMIETREDWKERQQTVQKKLNKLMGSFPDKSALNPRVTGTIIKNGYSIEKIIFESSPHFYVTGCLFIPDGISKKVPAVLNLIGHEQESFRAELDQLVIINLVKKGMIIFSIDPPGQGENVQYYDPEIDASSIGYSVIEHCYFGNQCFLTGTSSAAYFVWDAIRAIDYLASRDEVDTNRIGVTGFSGGGTITSYVSAIDDRVKVSVPSSWSTASQRQLETKGAQDAEAEILGSLTEGITFEDLIEVRAPKPTLLTFVSRDQYLALQGAIDCFNEAKSVFDIYGKPENLQLVVDDSRHWLTPKIRTSIYAFFIKHFNLEAQPEEDEIIPLSEQELQVTPTGQITTSLDGKRIFDLNEIKAKKLLQDLQHKRQDLDHHLKKVIDTGKELCGYSNHSIDQDELFINGRYQRDGYSISKYVVQGQDHYPLPFLLFKPDAPGGKYPALIYLHPQGKAKHANPGDHIEKLVRLGYIVVAMDPLGVGETKNTASRNLSPGYTGVLVGKSVVGIQASDIGQMSGFLKTLDDVDSSNISAIAYDEMCLPLIHASAFEPLLKKIVLIRPLISYRSITMNRFYRVGLSENEGGGTGHPFEIDFNWGVPGVLTTYDLPDLIACIAPRKVVMLQITDHMMEPVTYAMIQEELEFPRLVYSRKQAAENLVIMNSFENLESIASIITK